MPDMDLSSLFRQAQALQDKFKQMQEEAASRTVEAFAGGGMVRVVVDGAMHVRKIEIDATLIAANDKAMLEDLVAAAVNDGLRRAQEMVANEIGKLGPLAGMKFPGFGSD